MQHSLRKMFFLTSHLQLDHFGILKEYIFFNQLKSVLLGRNNKCICFGWKSTCFPKMKMELGELTHSTETHHLVFYFFNTTLFYLSIKLYIKSTSISTLQISLSTNPLAFSCNRDRSCGKTFTFSAGQCL